MNKYFLRLVIIAAKVGSIFAVRRICPRLISALS